MAQNNLRIIYDNVIDSATLTASTSASGLPVTNLQKEQKGFVWRSTTTTATITATWTLTQTLSGVVLPFCNLTNAATLQIKIYTNTTDTTPVLDTGVVSAGAYTPTDLWGGLSNISTGVNAYSYGGGTYARDWFATTQGKKLEIIITDTTNSSGYIELSRIVCGNYWSPTFNTGYGVGVGYDDTSEISRTESGNLITANGTVHKTLTFDMSWLTETDRVKMLSILRGNGLRKPIFISIFPDDAVLTKEQNYQIYGKLNNLIQITHPMYSIYASSLDIKEI